jgi:hypothetical protein
VKKVAQNFWATSKVLEKLLLGMFAELVLIIYIIS